MRRLALWALALTSLITQASAIEFDMKCRQFRTMTIMSKELRRPEPPPCAESFGSFLDEYSFNSCRIQMLTYSTEASQYQECLQEESENAAAEYNEAVTSFNRRARSTY